MNFFWIIALAQAASIIDILLTGRVQIRGTLLADRSLDLAQFRFYVACFLASEGIIIYEAIYPPYST